MKPKTVLILNVAQGEKWKFRLPAQLSIIISAPLFKASNDQTNTKGKDPISYTTGSRLGCLDVLASYCIWGVCHSHGVKHDPNNIAVDLTQACWCVFLSVSILVLLVCRRSND